MEKEKQEAASIPAMLLAKSPSLGSDPGAETKPDPLHQSLRELKDLRSQLYDAADYFEAAFPKAEGKTLVMETTKGYICQSIITVIDHLGTLSYYLDHRLRDIEVPRTDQRIDCLKQKLLTYEQYAHLNLSTMGGSPKLPKHHRHYAYPDKASSTYPGTEIATAVPFSEDSLRIPKPRVISFGSQTEDAHLLRNCKHKKKIVQGSNFLSFLRTSRRKT